MQSYKAFYLHGFLSSGGSEKGQWFKQKLAHSQQNSFASKSMSQVFDNKSVLSEWLTPTYPISSVANTVSFIESELVALLNSSSKNGRAEKVVLVGSSMGGFYAQYFAQKYQLPFIMINPALNPEAVFREHLGVHKNPSTGEMVEINDDYIEALLRYKITQPNYELPSLLLIDKDDEVIDVGFAIQIYQSKLFANSASKTIVYNGGDHRFIHLDEAWKEINQFLEKLTVID